jgi:hypothetical protein
MRHKAALSAFGFILLVILAVGFGFLRNARLATRFAAIHVGASQDEVKRILGTPSWTEPCGKSFGTTRPHCTEYMYRNSFAPLIPEYYAVSLDDSGHVLDTYVYQSP